jgi:hypothetical protein
MIQGRPDRQGIPKLFKEHPHMTWDNFFSGDNIMEWLGKEGFGATMTCRRDRLPNDIPGENLHKQTTKVDQRSKACRFLQPIAVVKSVGPQDNAKPYTRVHVSFQSMSSCNLSMVNAVN